MSDGVSSPMIVPDVVQRGVRWGLDYITSVGYGVTYDYIFERFRPYQALKREVLDLVESTVASDRRRDVHILDVGCGPANVSLMLAQAGYSVTGLDGYEALLTLAREKRRAAGVTTLAFTHGDLARNRPFKPESFDVVVSMHFLYAHPAPLEVLREAYRVLRPGGHALLVNLTRRVKVRQTFRDLYARAGFRAALHSLLWVVPNTMFETLRRPGVPSYWTETEFGAHLGELGFEVLRMRRTFLDGASLLVLARKPGDETPNGAEHAASSGRIEARRPDAEADSFKLIFDRSWGSPGETEREARR